MPVRPSKPILYRVAMADPAAHEFSVTMDVPAVPDHAQLVLAFAAWVPGSYMVRDFVRHVYDLEVTDGRGVPLPIRRLDKQRWRVDSGRAPFRVRYRVFAFDESVRAAFLDQDRAFWNGTSLFFRIEEEANRPCRLLIDVPRGWKVSTALPPVSGTPNAFAAASYDHLVDAPCAVGTHRRLRFRAAGTGFEIAWYGRSNADLTRVKRGINAIVTAAGRMFGGFPFKHYVFFINAMPQRGGGLEHACSCTCNVDAHAFTDESGYQDFFELVAHEFFHAWNVKRIADRVLGPFDYDQENYTTLLWFHEGFTEYMEGILLRSAGLIVAEKWLRDLGAAYGKFMAMPGRNRTPLSQLSFEAWIKQYKPAENFSNRSISYYEKGKWLGLVLDLHLRARTQGRRGLPDLFRLLWRRYGRRGQGITHEDVVTAASEIGGTSMQAFFRRYVDGVVELPVPSALTAAGVTVTRAPSVRGDDPITKQRAAGWLGVALRGDGGRAAVVKNVVPRAPAERAGLTFNDEIVAIDGVRVDGSTFADRIRDHRPGQRVPVAFFRNNQLRTVTVTVGRNPAKTFSFTLDPQARPEKRSIRRGWLGA